MSLAKPPFILVVASSGRMLAQAARMAGLTPLVIDLFADQDTQSYAEACHPVPSLANEHLDSAVAFFVKHYSVEDVVYGSGLEYFPDSLFYLHNKLNILGNHPDTFIRLLDKKDFFSVLDRLAILYPTVSFTAPDKDDNWLIKPQQGQGGTGVQIYRQDNIHCSSVYWQKYQTGSSHSLLFFADGQRLQEIGFNRQWSIEIGDDCFRFSGVMNNASLTEEQKRQIKSWLKQLIPEYKLKGLNSIDFIQAGDECYLLEINARPSASMQLYSGDLLTAHIHASQGLLCNQFPVQKGFTAYQIVYARQELRIPEGFKWPGYCMDMPVTGSNIGAGQPICSIIAHQNREQAVLNQLAVSQQTIINSLERFQNHAIYG